MCVYVCVCCVCAVCVLCVCCVCAACVLRVSACACMIFLHRVSSPNAFPDFTVLLTGIQPAARIFFYKRALP